MPDDTSVTVLVCTRDRPGDATRAVRSLLVDPVTRLRVVLVDQSTNDETARAFARYADPRLHYIRSRTVGKGAALNVAIRHADSEYVAFTDDDCEATPHWLCEIIQPLRDRSRVGLVFSNVVAPPHDAERGYVPQFVKDRSREIEQVMELRHGWGLGAGMAARLGALRAIGGADEMLGPGATFPSADDLDFEIRFLLAGWHVYEAADASIIHHGFRTWSEGRAHAVRDWQGIGGCIAKSVRSFHPTVVCLGLVIVTKLAVWPALIDIFHLRRPRLRRITAFLSSFFRGVLLPVDRHSIKYAAASIETQAQRDVETQAADAT